MLRNFKLERSNQNQIIYISILFSGEKPRSENLEAENNPEQLVNNAVSIVESRDTADPVISSEWMRESKNFLKNPGKCAFRGALDFSRVGLFTVAKAVWSILRFTKKMMEKRGGITFKEGYEIGSWVVDTDIKKNKN